MTRIYATITDLPSDLQGDPNAEDLIRRASNLVTSAIRSARFATDEDGMPMGDDLEAARDAVVIQVSTWLSTGVNPITGHAAKARQVASKGSNGSTVSYVADGAQAAYLNALVEGTALTPSALVPLEAQGLLSVYLLPGGPTYPRPFLGGPMFVGGDHG